MVITKLLVVSIFALIAANQVSAGCQSLVLLEYRGIIINIPDLLGIVHEDSKKSSCIFPFRFDAKTYDKCTHDGKPLPWCATKVAKNGEVLEFGVCDADCPVDFVRPRCIHSSDCTATTYCSNEIYDFTWGECIEKVDCGGGQRANQCDQCPSGGCNGDCKWHRGSKTCLKKYDENFSIACSNGHFHSSCNSCEKKYCSGDDCKWHNGWVFDSCEDKSSDYFK